jgi:Lhr-like helicase
MTERKRKSSDRFGLPPELAATNHLGKQLAAKRKAEGKVEIAAEAVPRKATKRVRAAAVSLGSRKTAGEWFAEKGWQPFAFQTQTWEAIGTGKSGLVHASTGTGKTYAVWCGVLDAYARERAPSAGAQVLWLTPMRALAADSAKAMQAAADGMGTGWRVEVRTGDTDSATKTQQTKAWPHCLVTTPESVSVLLTRGDASAILGSIKAIVVDEWHELMGNKRGVQTQLAIARIRAVAPWVQIWGVSATLGNLEEAAQVLLGADSRQRTEDAHHRHTFAHHDRTLPVGGPHRAQDVARGDCRD